MIEHSISEKPQENGLYIVKVNNTEVHQSNIIAFRYFELYWNGFSWCIADDIGFDDPSGEYVLTAWYDQLNETNGKPIKSVFKTNNILTSRVKKVLGEELVKSAYLHISASYYQDIEDGMFDDDNPFFLDYSGLILNILFSNNNTVVFQNSECGSFYRACLPSTATIAPE